MANHRMVFDTYPPERGTRTKWDILIERKNAAKAEYERLAREIHGLANTPCGLTCAGCGTLLVTEADFASHFIIPDENYLNLGGCPNA